MIATVGEQTERRPGRPRDARIDELVVEATLAEVTDKGFGAVTMEGIAGRAGIGKATLYRRWPNRDAVFRFVAARVVEPFDPTDTGDLRKDLLAVFAPLAEDFFTGGPARLLPDLCAQAAHDDDVRRLVRDLAREHRAGALAAFERARARGELRPGVDADLVIDMISGALLYRFLLLGATVDRQQAAAAVDIALEGILRPE